MRAIVVRLREYVGNRRRSTRHAARLSATVYVRSAPEHTGGADVPAVVGHTRDISRSGIALILPAIRAGSVYLTREGTLLRITLEVPGDSPLELDAAPVRYHQLEPEDGTSARQYLIGVRFINLDDPERTRLADLLTSLARRGGDGR